MKRLKPFFSYFGSKWKLAPHYPKPRFDTIIEPFAGSACYSMLYPEREVILCEINPVIAGIWKYLISASEDRISQLPVNFHDLSEVDAELTQDEKNLIAFNIRRSNVSPIYHRNNWNYSYPSSFWSIRFRQRIADQLKQIRHWKTYCTDYSYLTNGRATWFVDPPYEKKGKPYDYTLLNYAQLGEWCKQRSGQAIVCESAPANWLPFFSLGKSASVGQMRSGSCVESIWTNDTPQYSMIQNFENLADFQNFLLATTQKGD